MIRAIWVELLGNNPALSSAEALKVAFERISQGGYSDVFLQVYRGGLAWFETAVAETASTVNLTKFDPLANALELGAKFNLKIHAWINVFNLSNNLNHRILSVSKAKILHDNFGNCLTAYSEELQPPGDLGKFFQLDAPKIWLDPSDPEVKLYLTSLLQELFRRYSKLAGLHLDFFRYPYCLPTKPSSRIAGGIDFAYGPETIARFERDLGQKNIFILGQQKELIPASDDLSLCWDRWRRQQITDYLPVFKGIIGPQRTLSAAVLAWADRAFLTSYQNWRTWLTDGLVDLACPMAYTADDELFLHLVKQAATFQTGSSKVLAGIGAYLLKDQAQLQRQIEIAQSLQVRGTALFSYRNIFEK